MPASTAPRSIDAIKGDSDLADWRRGADFAQVPLLLDHGSSRRINISLDRGLLEAIDDEPRQRQMTRSAFLATVARQELEGTSPEAPATVGTPQGADGRRSSRRRRRGMTDPLRKDVVFRYSIVGYRTKWSDRARVSIPLM